MIGTDIIKTTGKVVFSLQRGDETTTRTVDVPYPKTDAESVESIVSALNTTFTSSTQGQNLLIQPANWRDDNVEEKAWTTTGLVYEITTTTTTPVSPESNS